MKKLQQLDKIKYKCQIFPFLLSQRLVGLIRENLPIILVCCNSQGVPANCYKQVLGPCEFMSAGYDS